MIGLGIKRNVNQQELLIVASFPLAGQVGNPSTGVLTIGILPITFIGAGYNNVIINPIDTRGNGLNTTSTITVSDGIISTTLNVGNGHTLGAENLSLKGADISGELSADNKAQLVSVFIAQRSIHIQILSICLSEY